MRGALANVCLKMADDEFRKVCEVFRFDSFNKHQDKALRFVSESKSNGFVNLLTGSGKSVVFQVLPIVYSWVDLTREKNIVLVVSPLINLIKTKSAA